MSWFDVKLKDICSLVTSGGTPLRSVSEYYEGGTIPWMKTGEVKRGLVFETEEYITEKALKESSAKLIPINSLIVAMYGDGITAGNVAINKIPLATNQACCNFVIDPEKAFYKFIYFYLKASYSNLVGLKLGGSQQNLNAKSLKEFPLRIPELAVQKKIAAALSSYDDLIENNRRRIELLEQMAEELYREWFVRFRFPGYQQAKFEKGMPVGWNQRKLPEIAAITYGFAFEGARFNSDGIGRPIIRIRNIRNSDTQDFTDQVADGKYLVRQGDLLVGMDGEFHMGHWSGEEAYLVQRVCKIKPKQELLDAYVSHALRAPIKHFESTIMGATVGHLGAKHLNSIDVLIPPGYLSAELEVLNSMKTQILNLSVSTRRLGQNRAALLGRLISGKLPVDQLDIQFPPSMREADAARQEVAHA